MAILLSDNEYAAFKRLLANARQADSGRGPRPVPVILRGSSGKKLTDWRHNAPRQAYQVTYVDNANPDTAASNTDWEDRVLLDPCSAAGARPGGGGGSLFAINGMEGRGAAYDGGTDLNLSQPNTLTVQISTANLAKDGTGTMGTVLTAGASGGTLFRVKVKAVGATSKGAIRIFHQPAGTGTVYWIGQLDVPETTADGIESTWEGTWFADDAVNGFLLDASDKIYASTHEANSFNVTGIGADI